MAENFCISIPRVGLVFFGILAGSSFALTADDGAGSGYILPDVQVTGVRIVPDLNPVTITGSPLQSGAVLFPATLLPYSNLSTFFRGVRGRVPKDQWIEHLEDENLALKSPRTTNDVRCSSDEIASPATKATTSLSDSTSRFVAANQLYTALRVATGAAFGLRAIISRSLLRLIDRKYQPTFTVIWADGGSENYLITPGLENSLIIESGNLTSVGNGIVQACPYPFIG